MAADAFAQVLARCVADESVVERIRSILGGYACLEAEPLPPHAAQPFHHPKTKTPLRHHHNNNNNIAKPPRVKLLGSSALLNKLTRANYATISQKCRTVLRLSSDVGPQVDTILMKAFADVTFTELYFDLIVDLQIVDQVFRRLLEHGIQKMTEFHASDDPATDDYDAFCRRNKEKSVVMGMNELILRLIADKKLTKQADLPPTCVLASHSNYINYVIGQNVSITMLRQLKRAFEVLQYRDSKFVESLQLFLKGNREALSMQEIFAIEDIVALIDQRKGRRSSRTKR